MSGAVAVVGLQAPATDPQVVGRVIAAILPRAWNLHGEDPDEAPHHGRQCEINWRINSIMDMIAAAMIDSLSPISASGSSGRCR